MVNPYVANSLNNMECMEYNIHKPGMRMEDLVSATILLLTVFRAMIFQQLNPFPD